MVKKSLHFELLLLSGVHWVMGAMSTVVEWRNTNVMIDLLID